MKTNFKFQDGAEDFILKTGEKCRIEKDCNGFWGFRSDKGYNLWEGGNEALGKTKKQAIAILKDYESIEVLNAKYN